MIFLFLFSCNNSLTTSTDKSKRTLEAESVTRGVDTKKAPSTRRVETKEDANANEDRWLTDELLQNTRDSFKKSYTYSEWKAAVEEVIDENPILDNFIETDKESWYEFMDWADGEEVSFETIWRFGGER